MTVSMKSTSTRSFPRYYATQDASMSLIREVFFLALKSTNISKPEGTNLSTLGLNNITNYLDYFQDTYGSLTLAAMRLSCMLRQPFSPCPIKME